MKINLKIIYYFKLILNKTFYISLNFYYFMINNKHKNIIFLNIFLKNENDSAKLKKDKTGTERTVKD